MAYEQNLVLFEALEARATVDARGLPAIRRLPGVGEDPARADAAREDHRGSQSLRAAGPGRRGVPDRREVELHAALIAGAEIRGLQFGRIRARHLPRSRHPALQPAFGDRGHGDRRLCDDGDRRLQLHSRRILGRAHPALRSGAGRGLRGGTVGKEHPGLGRRFRSAHLHRRRRLHLRRGDGAARVARGQTRQTALQAAVSRQFRSVRQTDHDQQYAKLRLRADDHAQGRRVVRRPRAAELRRHDHFFRLRPRRQAGQFRAAARHSRSASCWRWRAACGRAASSRR